MPYRRLCPCLLQTLGQTEIEQETKFLAIAVLICLNRAPSGPQSNSVVVNAFPKFEASVSKLNLVIPSCAALSKPCQLPKLQRGEHFLLFVCNLPQCPGQYLCCLSQHTPILPSLSRLRKPHQHSTCIARLVVVSIFVAVPDLGFFLNLSVWHIHLDGNGLSCIPPQHFAPFLQSLPCFLPSTTSTATQ